MINTLIFEKYRRKEGNFSGRSMIAPTISNETEAKKRKLPVDHVGALIKRPKSKE